MNSSISFKNINKLAIPALIAGVSEPILSLTDTAIIGNVKINPIEALAAIGIVGTFLSMLIWVFGQTRSAISSTISQYLGAGRLEEVKNLPAQAIAIIVGLSIFVLGITHPFANSIFKLYNADGLLLKYCTEYYQIRAFGLPLTLFTTGIFGTFRGLQNTYYPMLIAIVGVVVNIILDIILVYGISDYIEPLHIKGAAYASIIAQLIMAILSGYLLIKKTTISLRFSLPFNPEIKNVIVMIANLFVRTIALNVTLYLATYFATNYGKTYIAAHTIAINIWFLGAFIIDGYSSAGNIISGKFLGAKAYKELLQLSNQLIKYGISVGALIAIVGFLFYYPIGRIFTNEPEVLAVFYDSFWVILIMQPFCAIAFIFDGIFKGMGRMKILRNLLLLTTFFIFIPLLFLLDYYALKLHAVYIAMLFWVIARGLPLIIKFRRQFLPLSQKQ